MLLFDTGYLIDLINGDEGAIRIANEVDAAGAFKAISVVTAHEYLRGIFYLHQKNPKMLSKKLEKAERELERFEILPYTIEIAKLAAKIDAELTRRGTPISFADVVIAATSLHHGLTLVSRNVKHFGRIQNLKIRQY